MIYDIFDDHDADLSSLKSTPSPNLIKYIIFKVLTPYKQHLL